MLFFYLRHGEPIYHPDSLTPQGLLQAEALSKRLALYGMDQIFSSTSERAKMTAQPLCDKLGVKPVLLEWCNEHLAGQDFYRRDLDLWCFQQTEWKTAFCSPEVLSMGEKWYDHPAFAKTTFKEGYLRIEREADAFFETLGYRNDREKGYYLPIAPSEKRVALFAHQGFGMAFLSAVLNVPYPLFCSHFDFGFTGMTVIEFRAEDGKVFPKVLQLSNDSHLYREGLVLNYQNKISF